MNALASVLLPYQRAIWEDRRQVVVTEKCRRSGGSWTLAGKASEHASQNRGNVYYQSYDLDMTANWIEKAAQWASRLRRAELVASAMLRRSKADQGVPWPGIDLRTGEDIDATKFRLRFANGRRVEALSSAPRAIRSKGDPGDLLIIDEAAFIGLGLSVEKREAHWKAVLSAMLAITMWGGRIEIISTHNGDMSGFNILCDQIKRGEVDYGHRRIDIDRAIGDGLARVIFEERHRLDPEGGWQYLGEESDEAFRRQCYDAYKALPAEVAAEELGCIPQASLGRYLEHWLIDRCMEMAPTRRFEGGRAWSATPEADRHRRLEEWLARNVGPLLESLDLDAQHVFGFDFGRHRNPSVLAVVELGRPLRTRWLLELHGAPHSDQIRALLWIASRLPRCRGGRLDATGIGHAVAEAVADKMSSAVPETLTQSWWAEEAPRYKGLLEDRAIVIPRSDDVMDDHRAIERGLGGVPGLPSSGGARHGDSAVALMLAAQQARRPSGPVAVQPLGAPPASQDTADRFRGQRPARTAFRGWLGRRAA